ncbi:MAG: ribokinase, partial [Chloroflexi bacterium]|nr:ribokinase [Chloroflexota bacterium]
YLVIGHITQDLTPEGTRLGGTATYAALTARALGLQAALVTSAAPDAPANTLAEFPALRLPSEHSTTFENIYDGNGRTQFLRAVAAPIALDSVPHHWQRTSIVHLAPVAREIDPRMAEQFPASFVGLTPQGWLREWNAAGRVRPADWPEAETTLRYASAVVLSDEDVRGDRALVDRWATAAKVLVITEGEAGATVYSAGQGRRFPAPAVEVVDPTGAGDIFAAAFFVRLREAGDPWQAARFAVTLASASVTRRGLGGIPIEQEVVAARNSSRIRWFP